MIRYTPSLQLTRNFSATFPRCAAQTRGLRPSLAQPKEVARRLNDQRNHGALLSRVIGKVTAERRPCPSTATAQSASQFTVNQIERA